METIFLGLEDVGNIIKTNIKSGNVYINGEFVRNDIYIEDGCVKDIKPEIRQGMFSGVYELDAQDLFVVPTFVDCGCFALGSRIKGKEIPVIRSREYKRMGFFEFITSINILDRKERLINQEKQIVEYRSQGLDIKYLSGGMKDRAYHINRDIYTDIKTSRDCVGASVIYNDSHGSISPNALSKLCSQVEAVSYDYKKNSVVYLFLGDLCIDCDALVDSILREKGRQKTIMLWFANRSRAILKSCIKYLQHGGYINLVAGGRKEDMSSDFVDIASALLEIYEQCGSLDGVFASSFCGSFLPSNEGEKQRTASISNLYFGIKAAVEKGLPFSEALKVLCFNPQMILGEKISAVEKNKRARFLVVDEKLNIMRIIDGQEVFLPNVKNDLLLFI